MSQKRVLITHCERDKNWGKKLEEGFKRVEVCTKRICVSQDGVEDSSVKTDFVYWLPLITQNTLSSGANVASIQNFHKKLGSSEYRSLPLLVGNDDDMRCFFDVLPEVARRMPMLLDSEQQMTRIPETIEKKFESSFPPPIQGLTFFDDFNEQDKALWFDCLWEKETKDKKVTTAIGEKIGLNIEYIMDNFENCIVSVSKDKNSIFKLGDRLVEVEGYPINGNNLRKILPKLTTKKALCFKVRSPNGQVYDFEKNLSGFRERKRMWSSTNQNKCVCYSKTTWKINGFRARNGECALLHSGEEYDILQ